MGILLRFTLAFSFLVAGCDQDLGFINKDSSAEIDETNLDTSEEVATPPTNIAGTYLVGESYERDGSFYVSISLADSQTDEDYVLQTGESISWRTEGDLEPDAITGLESTRLTMKFIGTAVEMKAAAMAIRVFMSFKDASNSTETSEFTVGETLSSLPEVDSEEPLTDPVASRYWRFVVTSLNGNEGGQVALINMDLKLNGGDYVASTMTSANSGSIGAESVALVSASSSLSEDTSWLAFNGDTLASLWVSEPAYAATAPFDHVEYAQWIQIDFGPGNEQSVTGYRLQTGASGPHINMCPDSDHWEYSSDGANWIMAVGSELVTTCAGFNDTFFGPDF